MASQLVRPTRESGPGWLDLAVFLVDTGNGGFYESSLNFKFLSAKSNFLGKKNILQAGQTNFVCGLDVTPESLVRGVQSVGAVR